MVITYCPFCNTIFRNAYLFRRYTHYLESRATCFAKFSAVLLFAGTIVRIPVVVARSMTTTFRGIIICAIFCYLGKNCSSADDAEHLDSQIPEIEGNVITDAILFPTTYMENANFSFTKRTISDLTIILYGRSGDRC